MDAPNLPLQRAPAALEFFPRELRGGAGRTRTDVGESHPEVSQVRVLLVGERLGDEPGGVEQAPEGIARTGEVMARGAGSQARVDSHEEQPRMRDEYVAQGHRLIASCFSHRLAAAWRERGPAPPGGRRSVPPDRAAVLERFGAAPREAAQSRPARERGF